jgi:hypothetical protein
LIIDYIVSRLKIFSHCFYGKNSAKALALLNKAITRSIGMRGDELPGGRAEGHRAGKQFFSSIGCNPQKDEV